MLLGSVPALAKPEYARREARACQHCHVSYSPNALDPITGKREPTTRNARGLYYGNHNRSFQGFKEPEMKFDPTTPTFRFLWKEDLTEQPRRIAVADVTGDGKARLITLNEVARRPNSSVLMVKKWDGKAFVTEFQAEINAPADRLAAGRFAGKNRPAVIVTGDAAFQWDGKAFVRYPAAKTLTIFGSTRLRTGEERLLLSQRDQIVAYRVQPLGKAEWLSDPIEAPGSSQVFWGDMHAPPDTLAELGVPTVLGQGGLVGLWAFPQLQRLFLYYVKIDQDFETKPDPRNKARPQFILKNSTSYVVFRNPQERAGPELWSTPRLKGIVYDIALENPQGDGKSGLLVLTSESPTGPGRALYFFSQD